LVADKFIDNFKLYVRIRWRQSRAVEFGELVMQTAQLNLFEVILYFEDNSWLFSTCAQATRLQEALERAENEFSIHSTHHQLGNRKMKATSAHVIDSNNNHSFTKRDGKWQPAH
jgi:hypothetical protein